MDSSQFVHYQTEADLDETYNGLMQYMENTEKNGITLHSFEENSLKTTYLEYNNIT